MFGKEYKIKIAIVPEKKFENNIVFTVCKILVI